MMRAVRVRNLTRHVSVKDVAARSGVSFQTTSKVLNGKGSVSDATRARILRAARDLGYVPNLLARSLGHLEHCPDHLLGMDVARLRSQLRAYRQEILASNGRIHREMAGVLGSPRP